MRYGKRYAVCTFAAAAAAVLNSFGAKAETEMAPPPVANPETNVFVGITGGTPIVVGMALGDFCKVTDLELHERPNGAGPGYLKKSKGGDYAVGDGVGHVSIHCEGPGNVGVNGAAYAGDNDPKIGELSTIWTIDGVSWELPIQPDGWWAKPLNNAKDITITSRGDSLFFTLETVLAPTAEDVASEPVMPDPEGPVSNEPAQPPAPDACELAKICKVYLPSLSK